MRRPLGATEEAAKLSEIVSNIHRGDEYTSRLAENAERAAAKLGTHWGSRGYRTQTRRSILA
jgi:hypothetical protein